MLLDKLGEEKYKWKYILRTIWKVKVRIILNNLLVTFAVGVAAVVFISVVATGVESGKKYVK